MDLGGAGIFAGKTSHLALGRFPTNPAQHVEAEQLDAPETYMPGVIS
jgi:hypothetical protein